MDFDPGPGWRHRLTLDLARRHRLAGGVSVALVVSLVGMASAFSLSDRPEQGPRRLTPLPHAIVTTTATTATTVPLPTPTTTTVPPPTTTTTTGPPPTTLPPRPPAAAPTTSPPRPVPTACASALPAQLATTGGAHQMITVEAAGYGVTSATLTAWQWSGSCWTVADGPWTARIGSTGLSTHKHEGDGSTPAGLFGIQSTIYGNAPNPGVHYSYRLLVCGDWWDEDSSSPTYNTFQEVPCSETHPPFANGSSEALWTETVAYPSFAVINDNPGRVPGLGSAIFFHADVGGPTAGCVSLPLDELNRVLDWLEPAENPVVVMGTNDSITSY
jgi:L,D-peptidoglycan transpeptidase YkuD (ErfK/YbiS/YcfS/YnhG family)